MAGGLSAQGLSARGLACMRGERMLFSGLDLDLKPGEFVELTGPNGSGKSTLLRALSGLGQLFAGTVSWRGDSIADDPDTYRRNLVYSAHLDGLKSVLTAGENLKLFAELRGVRDTDPADALAHFDLSELINLPVGFMSAGQRRRVALARLKMVDAPVWLLDEPLTALDVATVDRVGQIIADHCAAGGMVMAATHATVPGIAARAFDLTEFTVDYFGPDGWDDEDDFADEEAVDA